jgi:hypothetical protein
MRPVTLGLVVILFLVFLSAHAADKFISLQDMEGQLSIDPWPEDRKLEITNEWAADGKKSLKLHLGTATAFGQENMTTSDWRPYNVMRMVVKNPTTNTVTIGIEFRDKVKGYRNSCHYSVTASPGVSTIDIDVTTFWRGEINKQWADSKEGFHKEDIKRFAFFVQDGDRSKAIYIDKIQLGHIEQIKCPGGFAFDFSDGGGHYQRGWSPVHPWLKYNEKKGFGIEGKSRKTGNLPLPTKVLGDGITLDKAAFLVNLNASDYIGWYVQERSGFWGGETSDYNIFSLLANGKAVATHKQKLGFCYFGFEDTEITTQKEIVEDLVFVRAQHDEFKFKAKQGINKFSIRCEGGSRTARLAGLVIAPDTKQGREYIRKIKQQQFDEVARVNKMTDKSVQGSKPESAKENIIIGPMAASYAMKPLDWPSYSSSQPLPALFATSGNRSLSSSHIGLFVKDGRYKVTVSTSPFKSETHTLPAKNILVQFGRYMPRRDYDGTTCWIETHHYAPELSAIVGKDLARSLLISLALDKGTAPGLYTSQVTLTFTPIEGGKSITKQVALSAHIAKGSLTEVSIPTGLFNSAVAVPSSLVGEKTYWELYEKVCYYLGKADKSVPMGGVSFNVSWQGNTPTISGGRALRVINLMRKHSRMDLIVTYGGFGLQGGNTPLKKKNLFTAFTAFQKENNLPPYYFARFDEPHGSQDYKAFKTAINRVKSDKDAGFQSSGFSSMHGGEMHKYKRELYTLCGSVFLNGHDKASFAALNKMGTIPMLYNNGLQRYDQGIHLYRNIKLGAKARIDWIGAIIQGFQYDMLDAREPDLSVFYFHSKHGVLFSPAYVGVSEGAMDARILLSLETKKNDAKIAAFMKRVNSAPYQKALNDDAINDIRNEGLALLGFKISPN